MDNIVFRDEECPRSGRKYTSSYWVLTENSECMQELDSNVVSTETARLYIYIYIYIYRFTKCRWI